LKKRAVRTYRDAKLSRLSSCSVKKRRKDRKRFTPRKGARPRERSDIAKGKQISPICTCTREFESAPWKGRKKVSIGSCEKKDNWLSHSVSAHASAAGEKKYMGKGKKGSERETHPRRSHAQLRELIEITKRFEGNKESKPRGRKTKNTGWWTSRTTLCRSRVYRERA